MIQTKNEYFYVDKRKGSIRELLNKMMIKATNKRMKQVKKV